MQHLALLLVTDGDALLATSVPLPGLLSSAFLALPFYNLCHQASSICPFTLQTKWLFFTLPAITLYVTAPSCVPASSSALPWALDSNAHDARKLPLCHSANSIGYISRLFGATSFSIASASASTTFPPLQASTSPLPAAPGCSIPRWEELTPDFLHTGLPRDCELLFRKTVCPATNVPIKKAAGLQVRPVPVFIATSIVFVHLIASCGAVSCSYETELPSGTTLPVGTGRPCGMVGIILYGASPCSIELAVATWCHSIN